MVRHILDIDLADGERRITHAPRHDKRQVFLRRGAVIGVSGGMDSSTVLGLFDRIRRKTDILQMGRRRLCRLRPGSPLTVLHGE